MSQFRRVLFEISVNFTIQLYAYQDVSGISKYLPEYFRGKAGMEFT